MSDILIKGIEMPKERESFTVTIKYNGLVLDTETGIQVAEAYELSPHGRLIDADALRCLYDPHDYGLDGEQAGEYDRYHVSLPVIRQNIDDMPTIIEAELPVHHGTFAATSEQEALKRIILPEEEE